MGVHTDARQPFLAHLRELKKRLLWSVALLLAGSMLGYIWHVSLIIWLQQPLKQPLYYTSPAGGFDFAIRISLAVGIFLALPAILYNVIRFIEPAFKSRLTVRH